LLLCQCQSTGISKANPDPNFLFDPDSDLKFSNNCCNYLPVLRIIKLPYYDGRIRSRIYQKPDISGFATLHTSTGTVFNKLKVLNFPQQCKISVADPYHFDPDLIFISSGSGSYHIFSERVR